MLHIIAKFTKYKLGHFLVENLDTGLKWSSCNSAFITIRNDLLGVHDPLEIASVCLSVSLSR